MNQSNVKRHKFDAHDWVKYNCDEFAYHGTNQSPNRRHKLAVHEGFKCKCDQCGF